MNPVYGSGKAMPFCELYDPSTGTWTYTGDLIVPRMVHTATLLGNGKVLVVGGMENNDSNLSGLLDSAELYDPVSGTWTATSSLSSPCAFHTATVLRNGQVLVAGGQNQSSLLSRAVLFDPVTGQWTSTGSMNTARMEHTATVLHNGQILVIGNDPYISVGTDSAELYQGPLPLAPFSLLLGD